MPESKLPRAHSLLSTQGDFQTGAPSSSPLHTPEPAMSSQLFQPTAVLLMLPVRVEGHQELHSLLSALPLLSSLLVVFCLHSLTDEKAVVSFITAFLYIPILRNSNLA